MSTPKHKHCPCCGTGNALFSNDSQPACDSCLDVMSRGGYPQFAKRLRAKQDK